MKNNIFRLIAIAIIALSNISCVIATQASAVKLSGETTTETLYAGQQITAIKASSMFQIELIQGNDTKAEITYNNELKERLNIELINGVLQLSLKNTNTNNFGDKGQLILKAKVTCSSLNSLDLTGMSSCTLMGSKFTSDNLEIELSGMSRINGSAILEVKKNVQADISGMAHLDCNITCAGNANVDISGMSNSTMTWNEASTLRLNVSGMSNITLKGQVNKLDLDCSGMSKVDAQKLKCSTRNNSTSGMSTTTL